jgi:hypothetical protein
MNEEIMNVVYVVVYSSSSYHLMLILVISIYLDRSNK